VADRHYVMESGIVVDEFDSERIKRDWDQVTRYLSV